MSRLTQVISLFYVMQPEDVRALDAQLLEARKRAWTAALRSEAARHGCNKAPSAPSGQDLAELKAQSADDAKSIAETYNKDVERQIEALYAENPRGNRTFYASRMEQWVAERNRWKQPQIGVTTDTTATEYARTRFRAMNYDGAVKYKFDGPATTCRDCTMRFAAGLVDEAYTRRYPCPRHVGCPHTWTVVRVPKIPCDELWLG